MIGLFTDFKKAFKIDEVKTDNLTFRMFYKGSVLLHFFFIILIGAKQFFGEPIDCHLRSNEVKRDFFNTNCWIHGTFTRRQFLVPDEMRHTVLNQGIGMAQNSGKSDLEDKIYHTYYQWIPFVLFCYGAICYCPRFFWKKIFEKERMKKLCEGFMTHVSFLWINFFYTMWKNSRSS